MDIRQFAYAGIDIYGLLADSMGKSTAEIQTLMSTGKIGYKEITDALKNASSEGGRFYGAMEKQSNTLNGIISNFQDNLGNLTGTLSTGFSEALKKVLKPINDIIDRINALLSTHTGFQNFTNSLVNMFDSIGNMIRNLSDEQLNGLIDFVLAIAKVGPLLIGIGAVLPKFAKTFLSFSATMSTGGGILSTIASAINPIAGIVVSAVTTLGSSITNFVGIFTGITAIVGVLGYVNNQTNNKLLEMSRMFAEKAPQIVKDFIAYFNAMLPMLITQGQAIIENLVTGIDEMLPSVLSAINTILTGIADTMKKSGRKVAKTFMDFVLGLAKVLIDNIPEFIAGMYEILMGMMDSIIENAPDLIQALADCLVKMLEVEIEYEDEFFDLGIKVIEAILDGLLKALPTIIKAIPLWVQRLTQVFLNNIELFIKVGGALLEGLLKGLIIAIPEIVKRIPEITIAIINAFKNAFGIDTSSNKTESIGKDIMNGLFNGISSMISKITNKVKDIGSSIINTLSGTNLWNTGYNMIQGLINGMENRKYAVQNMARDIGSGASTAMAAMLKIGSPSKLFEYFGEMTTEGYAIGLANGNDDIQRQMSSMINFQPNVSPTATIVQESPMANAFMNFINNYQERPVQIEVQAEEGLLVRKVTQGFKEFQRANGRLPF